MSLFPLHTPAHTHTHTNACARAPPRTQVRTHDGEGVFMVVDHDEVDAHSGAAPMGNVYSMGYNHSAMFALSLRRNFRKFFLVDFARVEGLPVRGRRCSIQKMNHYKF
jgi:hypothetical protein